VAAQPAEARPGAHKQHDDSDQRRPLSHPAPDVTDTEFIGHRVRLPKHRPCGSILDVAHCLPAHLCAPLLLIAVSLYRQRPGSTRDDDQMINRGE
jgi:hypothetical protein